MWIIKNLKTNTIAVLKQSYWQAFLASLILALIGGYIGASGNISWNMQSSNF